MFRQQRGGKTTACAAPGQAELMSMTMKHPWQLMIPVVIRHAMDLVIFCDTACAPAPVSVLYIMLAGHPQPERRMTRQRCHHAPLLVRSQEGG
ncbi:hypothetical protein BFW41_13425 [Aeromonas hydrophila]|nr:hypothetical protein TK34_13405 [Aeromonas hydrophila]AXV34873.1 hypothetical protein BFW41_13425 [Aeromonas hydrophila]